jgi:hypothetical protein
MKIVAPPPINQPMQSPVKKVMVFPAIKIPRFY